MVPADGEALGFDGDGDVLDVARTEGVAVGDATGAHAKTNTTRISQRHMLQA